MKTATRYFFWVMFFYCLAIRPANGQSISLEFTHYVNNVLLGLDTVEYKNNIEQSFTISKFKYYISNIILTPNNGTAITINKSFLVDEEVEASKKIELLNVKNGKYKSIEFMLGVDSLHNCSGVQTGDLDPMKGMFWTWNSGYIFFKLEGKSTVSKSPMHMLEYHIGGFKEPYNCIRKIKLELNKELDERNSIIKIKTDVAEIFKTPVTIDFSSISTVTDYHNAVLMADNYKDMFSIIN